MRSFSDRRVVASRSTGWLCAGGAGLAALALAACFDSKRIEFVPLPNQPGADMGVTPAGMAPGAAPAVADAGNVSEAPVAPGSIPLGGAPVAAAGAGADAGVAPALASAPCSLPANAPAGSTLFGGALLGGACQTTLDAPFGTSWFSYQDSGDLLAVNAVSPGCVPSTCALHVEGPPAGAAGYANYGAGLALPMTTPEGPFDATVFSGVQFWARGTVTGTRGPAASDAPQTLFFKLVTATNRAGDDFGAFCTLDPQQWTLCSSSFADLAREGFAAPDPATDVLDLQSLLRVELEFRLYRDALGAVPTPVTVSIDVADISFF